MTERAGDPVGERLLRARQVLRSESDIDTRGPGMSITDGFGGQPPTDDVVMPALLAGRYRMERELGRGGAAIVWLAREVAEDRLVAIKVLRPEIAHTVAADRFLEEIRIVTELSHPYLLPVHASGEFEGLLYYVTPYVEGGSLRVRMERERQLPLDDALALVSDVADALEYAHRHGVIHRDLKPENILIAGEHACVADFGIARALTRALDERITSTGITVGTPAYMSPEQAAGNRDLDERTDVYSLACVLYEMLAGVAPFIGPTPESVMAQRFVHAPHALRSYRATVPPEVEGAIARAMAIAPADRFRTMREFSAALSVRGVVSASASIPTRLWKSRWRLSAAAGLAALAGVTALLVTTRESARGDGAGASTDTTRYLVAAIDVDDAGTTPIAARRRMAAALGRWREITVAEPDGGVDSGAGARSPNAITAMAARVGAGRIVAGHLSSTNDSLELTANLLDSKGRLLRTRTARASLKDSIGSARLYAVVTAALLGEPDPDADWDTRDIGTDRVVAWQAFARAQSALRRWDLGAAIRELRLAVSQDPEYAQAQLWLAQALAWSRPDHADEWQREALRAGALASHLSRADSILAAAVAHLGAGEYPNACSAYRQALAASAQREVAWLGLGQCQAMDSAVVRDRRSPSGWRFRGSYHSAASAYDSAVAHASGAPEFAFAQFGRLFFVETFRVREGRAQPPDTLRFLAHPSLDADTIAFVPWSAAAVAASVPRTLPSTLGLALERNADRLMPRLREWVRRAPASAEALAMLANVEEVRGDLEPGNEATLAALATLRASVRATVDPDQRIRQSASVVRVLLKSERFAQAHAIADSLLASNPNPTPRQARYLAGIAALVAKLDRTERLLSILSSDPAEQPDRPLPQNVRAAAARLTAHAALGACTPRLASMIEQVEQLVDRYVSPAGRPSARIQALSRPLSLAVPCLGPAIVERIPDDGNRLIRMQRALARGDRAVVRAQLDTLARMRRVDRVGDIALDNTFQEAWLILAMHDSAQAQRHLCTPLSALPTLGTRLLRDVPQAAAVGRSLALCAQIAVRRGDSTSARHWAKASLTLWSTADAPLQTQLAELHPLTVTKR